MSYILDALRKSEQERQKATGQGISLPYTVTAKRERDSLFIPIILAVLGIFIVIAIWQMWPGVKDSKTSTKPAVAPVSTVLPPTRTVIHETPKASSSKPVNRKEIAASNDTRSASVSASPAKTSSDQLAGLPPLEISGFIHNEQSGNLAVINNTLMRDGDEVSPGLRVEKIRDDSVIFSYKGYVFTR